MSKDVVLEPFPEEVDEKLRLRVGHLRAEAEQFLQHAFVVRIVFRLVGVGVLAHELVFRGKMVLREGDDHLEEAFGDDGLVVLVGDAHAEAVDQDGQFLVLRVDFADAREISSRS